jgi:hypothetical protein
MHLCQKLPKYAYAYAHMQMHKYPKPSYKKQLVTDQILGAIKTAQGTSEVCEWNEVDGIFGLVDFYYL